MALRGPVHHPDDVRKYRRLIDDLDRALESLAVLQSGREASLVRTKIDEALLWAGMLPERKSEAIFAAAAAKAETDT